MKGGLKLPKIAHLTKGSGTESPCPEGPLRGYASASRWRHLRSVARTFLRLPPSGGLGLAAASGLFWSTILERDCPLRSITGDSD